MVILCLRGGQVTATFSVQPVKRNLIRVANDTCFAYSDSPPGERFLHSLDLTVFEFFFTIIGLRPYITSLKIDGELCIPDSPWQIGGVDMSIIE